jgi:8-oxo-dGTP diphosphatase
MKVGIGVCLLVVREKKLLVAERIGDFGHGCLAVAGGHAEYKETWQQAALRELYEEAGADIKVVIEPTDLPVWKSESNVPIFVTNNVLEGGKHYVTIWMKAKWLSGEAQNREPTKKKDWEWKTFAEIIKDDRMKDGVAAWLANDFHDSLHWMPLPELFKYREKIGI